MATMTSLGFSIFSRYDGSGVDRARRDLNDLNSDLERNQRATNQAAAGFSPLIDSVVIFGPALLEVGAAATAVAGGLIASTAAAAGAAGIWGLAAKAAMGMTDSGVKAADNLRMQQQILAGLTPGTKAYADQLLKVQAAQGKYNAAMAALGPVQQQYVKNVESLKVAWQGFITQTSASTLGPISTVLQTIAAHMSELVPLVTAVGHVAQGVADQFKLWADNGGIRRVVDLLVQYGVPALQTFILIAKNIVAVLSDGFKAFLPTGQSILDVLARGSIALKSWADGGGFQRFIAYVQSVAPQVREFFTALAQAIKNLGGSLIGVAPLSLQLATALLQIVAACPPGVIQAIVVAFTAMKVAMTGLLIVRTLATGIQALAVALGAARVAMLFLNAAFIASPVGWIVLGIAALVAGIVYLATQTKVFQTIWNACWGGIKTAAEAIWGFLKQNWQYLILALGPVGWLIDLATHWSTVWNGIKSVAESIWNGLKTAWSSVTGAFATAWNAVSGALTTAWTNVWSNLKAAGQTVWTAIQTAWQTVCNAFGTIWQTVGGAVSTAWTNVWNGIKTAGQSVWTAMQTAWQTVCNAFSTIWTTVSGALSGAWSNVWNAMKSAGQTIWTAMQTAWQTVLNALQTAWNTVGGAISNAWSTIWNGIKTAGTTIWSAIQTAWTTTLNAIQTAWNTVGGAISNAWSTIWNGIKTAGTTIWDAIKTTWQTTLNALKTAWDTVGGGLKTAWENIWNGIKTTATNIWNGIKTAVRDGINGVIDLVNGLIGAWDTIVGAVGLGGTLNISKISHVSFATGGYVSGPGTGTSDSIPARLSNGEYVIKADAVSRYGVGAMDAINSMAFAKGGLVGYATGGAVTPGLPGLPGGVTQQFPAGNAGAATGGSGPTPQAKKHTGILGTGIGPNVGPAIPGASIVGAVVNGVIDTTKMVLGFIGETVIHAALDPLVNAIAGNTPVGQIAAAGFKMLGKAMVDLLIKKDAEAKPKIGGVIPSGQHLAIIDAALAAAGVPPPGDKATWETGLNTLITRESAWNAGAINNTDSNAAAGIPSQGLAQVIPPTFAAYHVPGTSSNILDPVANVAAAIRYIVARYGNITNVQQANANLPPKGYWGGTNSTRRGWAMVDEKGDEWINFRGGDRVLPHGVTPTQAPAAEPGSGDTHVHFEDGCFQFHGTVTKDAIPAIKNDLVPALRMAVEAGVGKRRR